MSSTLFWQPKSEAKSLPDGLKQILIKLWDGTNRKHVELSYEDIKFLRGIELATTDDETKQAVAELIDAINAHGAVILWLAW